jgi:hypothetical protein
VCTAQDPETRSLEFSGSGEPAIGLSINRLPFSRDAMGGFDFHGTPFVLLLNSHIYRESCASSSFPGWLDERDKQKRQEKWITGVNPGYDTVMVMPVIQVVSLPVNGSVGRFSTAEIV